MMKAIQEYSVLTGMELDVCYGAESEIARLQDESIAQLNVLITNHNGNVVELKVMDWEFTDGAFFEEDEKYFTGFNIEGLTEVSDENEKRAFAQAQYTLNVLTIQEIIVTATLNDGTVTPLKVNNWLVDVASIQELN